MKSKSQLNKLHSSSQPEPTRPNDIYSALPELISSSQVTQSDPSQKTKSKIIKKQQLKFKYQCGHCPKKFAKRSNLRDHVSIHNMTKPFECNFCLKRFRQKGHLTYHKSHVHKDQTQIELINEIQKQQQERQTYL